MSTEYRITAGLAVMAIAVVVLVQHIVPWLLGSL